MLKKISLFCHPLFSVHVCRPPHPHPLPLLHFTSLYACTSIDGDCFVRPEAQFQLHKRLKERERLLLSLYLPCTFLLFVLWDFFQCSGLPLSEIGFLSCFSTPPLPRRRRSLRRQRLFHFLSSLHTFCAHRPSREFVWGQHKTLFLPFLWIINIANNISSSLRLLNAKGEWDEKNLSHIKEKIAFLLHFSAHSSSPRPSLFTPSPQPSFSLFRTFNCTAETSHII